MIQKKIKTLLLGYLVKRYISIIYYSLFKEKICKIQQTYATHSLPSYRGRKPDSFVK